MRNYFASTTSLRKHESMSDKVRSRQHVTLYLPDLTANQDANVKFIIDSLSNYCVTTSRYLLRHDKINCHQKS